MIKLTKTIRSLPNIEQNIRRHLHSHFPFKLLVLSFRLELIDDLVVHLDPLVAALIKIVYIVSALDYFANMKDHSPQSVVHEAPSDRLRGKLLTALAICEGEPVDVDDEYFGCGFQSNPI